MLQIQIGKCIAYIIFLITKRTLKQIIMIPNAILTKKQEYHEFYNLLMFY